MSHFPEQQKILGAAATRFIFLECRRLFSDLQSLCKIVSFTNVQVECIREGKEPFLQTEDPQKASHAQVPLLGTSFLALCLKFPSFSKFAFSFTYTHTFCPQPSAEEGVGLPFSRL